MPNARALPRWWASQREPEGVPPMDVASWPSARCLGPVRHGVGRASPKGDRGLRHLRITRQHCPTKGEGGENRKEAAAEPCAP